MRIHLLIACGLVLAPSVFGQNAYISNTGAGSVSVIDTSTSTVTATIPVGASPFGVAVSPDGARAYVSNQFSASVSVIDTSTNTVVATIPVGSAPLGVAVSPDSSTIYVANSGSNTVSVISAAGNSVTHTIAVGSFPFGVAITPDGSTVYVSNNSASSVSVISTVTNSVTNTISVTGENPRGLAVTGDGSKVYVGFASSYGLVVISTATNTVTSHSSFTGGSSGVAIANGYIWVTNFDSGALQARNPTTLALVVGIPIGSGPFGIAASSDGTRVYVSDYFDDAVKAVNTSNYMVVSSTGVGNGPYAFGNFLQSFTPSLASISPTAVAAGSRVAMNLVVKGRSLQPSFVIYFNGAPITTTFVSSTELIGAVPQSAMTTPGPVTVTVYNGGTNVGSRTFTLLAPVVSTLSPSSATAGGASFGLTVYGSNFNSASSVYFGKTALTTTYLGPTSLSATVPASAISAAGAVVLTVQNGSASATSNGVTFNINGVTPTLTSISPAYANQNAASFTLTANGSHFLTNSVVHLGSTALTTTYVSASQLTATVPATSLYNPGNLNVTVTNGAASSGAQTFQVRATSITLSPNTAPGGDFTLTVTGSNFNAGSVIMWGSQPLTTNYQNSTTLTASITAAQAQGTGTVRVTVVTNGGTSAGALFTLAP